MNWHLISFWNLTIALSRKGFVWWWDPCHSRSCLKAKTGAVYDFKVVRRFGCFIRKRYEMP